MRKGIASFGPVSFTLDVVCTYARVGVPRSAAALSYYLILTLFPLLMCMNFFIGLFHLDLEQIIAALDQVLPADVLSIMTDYLSYVAGNHSTALLWASLSAILLSASAGLRILFLTMDELYGVRRDNGAGRIMLSLVLSALFLLTIYLSVVVIFTGDWFFWFLEARLPERLVALLPLSALSDLWQWLRYLLLFCFVLLLVLALYWVGIPRGGVPRRVLRLSSVVTAVAMVACSVIFSMFIGLSSRYALVYGSLASLIILLVWLYFCGNILLLGAVVGQVWAQRTKKKNT